MRILAISGSLREASNNTALLRALREEAPAGVEVELWHGLKEIPPYDSDDDLVPGPYAVEAFRSLVREVDAGDRRIARLSVTPAGRRLLDRSRTVCLFVNDFNAPALSLYRHMGFRVVADWASAFYRRSD